MLAEITTAIGALKASSDVIRAVVAGDKALAVADLRLRLADATVSLADARVALVSVQEQIDARDTEIVRLRDALEIRTRVVRQGSAYYELDQDGKATGEGHCMRCYEADHKLFHLSYPNRTNEPTECPVCKSKYAYGHTHRIRPVE